MSDSATDPKATPEAARSDPTGEGATHGIAEEVDILNDVTPRRDANSAAAGLDSSEVDGDDAAGPPGVERAGGTSNAVRRFLSVK